MRITCPDCGFSRHVPDDKVPASSAIATCPRCKCRFKFREMERDTPAFAQDDAPRIGRPVRPARRVQDVFDVPAAGGDAGPGVESGPAPDACGTREDAASMAPVPQEPAPDAAPDAAPEPVEPNEHPAGTQAAPPLQADQDGAVSEPDPEPGAFPPPPRATWVPQEDGAADDAEPQPAADSGAVSSPCAQEPGEGEDQSPTGAPHSQAGEAPGQAGEAQASPVPEQEAAPEADGQAPAPQPAETAADPAAADKDGVRDIWARLQAMDDESAGEKPGKRPGPGVETPAPDQPEEPVSALEPEEAEGGEPPWERTGEGGFFTSFVLTLKKILFQPVDFFESLIPGRGVGRSMTFYLILLEFMLLVDFLWIFIGAQANLLDADQLAALNLPSISGPGFFVALLLTPLVFAGGLCLFSLVLHGLLAVFQCAGRGLAETFRVVFYSTAPVIFYAVPVTRLVMLPVVVVWIIALQAIGLKKVQGGPYANALAAIFIVWSICMFAFGAFLKVALPGFGV